MALLTERSTFGRIIPARFADLYGPFNVMLLHTLLCAIFTLAIWLPSRSNAVLIVYAALYGFASGCTFSIIPAMVAKISPDMSKIGARVGSLYAFSAVGALIGSPIAGAIVNAQGGGYDGLIAFSGASLMVGVGFAAVARGVLGEWKLLAKV